MNRIYATPEHNIHSILIIKDTGNLYLRNTLREKNSNSGNIPANTDSTGMIFIHFAQRPKVSLQLYWELLWIKGILNPSRRKYLISSRKFRPDLSLPGQREYDNQTSSYNDIRVAMG